MSDSVELAIPPEHADGLRERVRGREELIYGHCGEGTTYCRLAEADHGDGRARPRLAGVLIGGFEGGDFGVVGPTELVPPAGHFNLARHPACVAKPSARSSQRSCSAGSRAATSAWCDHERACRRRQVSICCDTHQLTDVALIAETLYKRADEGRGVGA